MENSKGCQGLTSYQLKWIAIVSMVIDHVGAVLFPSIVVFRYIGRISFPIFCFLLVEGFFHTKDVYRYSARLFLFALISEIPFDLAIKGEWIEFGSQNVFFTLVLGVIMMYVLEREQRWPVRVAEILLVMWAAAYLRTDYSYFGILMILIFYLLHDNRKAGLLASAGWNLFWNFRIQGYGALAVIPLALYNGERGRKMKYFFYIFYPAHLFVLAAIKSCMNQ